MILALHIHDPFDRRHGWKQLVVHAGMTIRDVLTVNFGRAFKDFSEPTLCMLNGSPVLFTQFEEKTVRENDTLTFSHLQGDVVTIVLAVISIVIAIVAVVMMPDPQIPGDQGMQGDPAYTLSGQQNRIRLGDPVEKHYGRCRVFPSYAAPPFNRYIANEQYQYSLFCWGVGAYDIDPDELMLEDTPLLDLDDVQVEIIPPGGQVTIFPDAVITSVEVANIELLGPNEAGYPSPDGWSGPYTVNPSGTKIDRVEVDMVFPQGLYYLNNGLRNTLPGGGVTFQVQVREIDDAGVAIGSWSNLFAATTVNGKSNNPQRFTYGGNVTGGRYQVRARRTSNKATGSQFVTTLHWESARGITNSTILYPGFTMLAVAIKASNQVNNNSRSRINGWSTSKLRTWDADTETWGAEIATRNPAWIFADVYQADYSEARLPDAYLDLVTLAELAAVYEEREDWFDFTADEPGTCWPMGEMVLRVGRTIPFPQGSFLTAVRDEPVTLPAALFNGYNVHRNSSTEEITLFEQNAADGLRIEYVNPDTWKPEQVLCCLPGEAGNYPKDMKLPGCTDRQRAYREGLYIRAAEVYRRVTVKLRTGSEGRIPTLFDLAAVSLPALDIGQGGMVLAYDASTKTVTTGEALTFAPGMQSLVVFRDVDGSAMGDPIACTPGANPNQMILATDPASAPDFDVNKVPPLYLFGPADLWAFMGRVVQVAVSGDQDVEVTMVNDDARVYSFDSFIAPPLPEVGTPVDPTAPDVENVILDSLPDQPNTQIISWKPIPAARRYELQISFDNGGTWDDLGDTKATTYTLPLYAADVKVRVRAVTGITKGKWKLSTLRSIGIIAPVPAQPTGFELVSNWTGPSVSVRWQPQATALDYLLHVYATGNPVFKREVETTGTSYTYTQAMAIADSNVTRHLTFGLAARNSTGSSNPELMLEVSNIPPAALTGLGSSYNSADGVNKYFTVSWSATSATDFYRYRVYGSFTPGFTADPSTLLYEGTGLSWLLAVAKELDGSTLDYYWRAVAIDIYGDDEWNLSAEQTIAATAP